MKEEKLCIYIDLESHGSMLPFSFEIGHNSFSLLAIPIFAILDMSLGLYDNVSVCLYNRLFMIRKYLHWIVTSLESSLFSKASIVIPFKLVCFLVNAHCRVNLEQMLYLPCQLQYAELVLLKRRHAFYSPLLHGIVFSVYGAFLRFCAKIFKPSIFRFHSISILQILLAKQT